MYLPLLYPVYCIILCGLSVKCRQLCMWKQPFVNISIAQIKAKYARLK